MDKRRLPHELWSRLDLPEPARRNFRRQNSKGQKTRRSARRAADEVRADHQSENCEADWRDNSARGARTSGQGDQVTEKRLEVIAGLN